MKKDKKMHILICTILIISLGLLIKKIWWTAPYHVLVGTTFIKEIILDYGLLKDFLLKYFGIKLNYVGVFDIADIKANAIGCVIGVVVLCIIKLF